MPLVNAYLVRWARGLIEVVEAPSIAAYGRHEGYLPLGGSQSATDAAAVAAAVLAVRAYPQVATTIGLRPTGAGDNPFVDFDLGDWLNTPDEDGTVTPARLRSMLTQDHPDYTGQVQFVPELRNMPAEAEDVLGRWLQRMATGGGGGASVAPPVPIRETPRPEKEPFPPWSLAVVRILTSGRYYATEPCRLVKIIPSLGTPGAGLTTVVASLNGTPISGATASWGAGEYGARPTIYLALDLDPGDYLTVATTAAGGGALGLTVQFVII